MSSAGLRHEGAQVMGGFRCIMGKRSWYLSHVRMWGWVCLGWLRVCGSDCVKEGGATRNWLRMHDADIRQPARTLVVKIQFLGQSECTVRYRRCWLIETGRRLLYRGSVSITISCETELHHWSWRGHKRLEDQLRCIKPQRRT